MPTPTPTPGSAIGGASRTTGAMDAAEAVALSDASGGRRPARGTGTRAQAARMHDHMTE